MESSLHDKPLVWFSQSDPPDKPRDCNCDPACSTSMNAVREDKYIPCLINRECEYILQEDLVYIRIGKYLLVANPTSSGQIILLNQKAVRILRQFKWPFKLETLAWQRETNSSTPSIEEVANLLLSLGFLRMANSPKDTPFFSNSDVFSIWLHITNNCNLQCSYCFVDKSPENINLDIAKQQVAQIIHSAKANQFRRFRFKYAGGEPTINIGALFSIHDEIVKQANCEKVELEAILLSNGVNFTDWEVDELIRRNIMVMISLDGVGEAHDNQRKLLSGAGSFTRVISTINKLKNRGMVPHISVTVTNRNLEGLPLLVEFLLNENLTFSLNFYRNPRKDLNDLSLKDANTIQIMRKVFKVIEKHLPKDNLLGNLLDRVNLTKMHNYTCGTGRNYIVIDHNGYFSSCQMDLSNRVAGTETKDILAILKNELGGLDSPVDSKEKCNACIWRYWCTGGCPLMSYKIYGRFDAASPNCSIYSSLIPDILRLEGLRLLKYTQPWSPSS